MIGLEEFWQRFRTAAAEQGFAEECLVETGAGPVWAFARVPDRAVRPVYLSSGIHGDEPAGPLAMLELMESGALAALGSCLVCPVLNPTGLVAGTRETAAGIDLNRDYLQRSTPEVRAHVAWLERHPWPAMLVSLHEDWESSGFYFYEINLAAEDPERVERIFAAVSPWLGREPSERIDDHPVHAPGWIFHRAEADLPESWPEAIFLAKSGCPLSFTFETPSALELERRVAAHVAAARVVLGCRRPS